MEQDRLTLIQSINRLALSLFKSEKYHPSHSLQRETPIYVTLIYKRNGLIVYNKWVYLFLKMWKNFLLKWSMDGNHQQVFYHLYLSLEVVHLPLFKPMYIFAADLYAANLFLLSHGTITHLSWSYESISTKHGCFIFEKSWSTTITNNHSMFLSLYHRNVM